MPEAPPEVFTSRLQIRPADEDDAPAIVRLFTENGSNPYGWTPAKWRHYYREYPEGTPLSLVAEIDDEIIGHYGILPLRIGVLPSALGLHAFVSERFRGLTVLSELMKAVDHECHRLQFAALCGFPNAAFARVCSALFKWRAVAWLGVVSGISARDVDHGDAPYRFRYTDAWYQWRFGAREPSYVSRHVDASGQVRKQLLKLGPDTEAAAAIPQGCEAWTRSAMFDRPSAGEFRQAFAVRIYDASRAPDMNDSRAWGIDMGDSDTFVYTPWSD
jgi:hypothetical protein